MARIFLLSIAIRHWITDDGHLLAKWAAAESSPESYRALPGRRRAIISPTVNIIYRSKYYVSMPPISRPGSCLLEIIILRSSLADKEVPFSFTIIYESRSVTTHYEISTIYDMPVPSIHRWRRHDTWAYVAGHHAADYVYDAWDDMILASVYYDWSSINICQTQQRAPSLPSHQSMLNKLSTFTEIEYYMRRPVIAIIYPALPADDIDEHSGIGIIIACFITSKYLHNGMNL